MKFILLVVLALPAFASAQWLGEGEPSYTVYFERWSVAVKDDREQSATIHRDYDLVGFSLIRPWPMYGPHSFLFLSAAVSVNGSGDSVSTLPAKHFIKNSTVGYLEAGGMWIYQKGALSLAPLIYLKLPADLDYLARNVFLGALFGGAGVQAGWSFHPNFELSLRASGEGQFVDSDHRSASGFAGRLQLTYAY